VAVYAVPLPVDAAPASELDETPALDEPLELETPVGGVQPGVANAELAKARTARAMRVFFIGFSFC
jgi:hypothetical protein